MSRRKKNRRRRRRAQVETPPLTISHFPAPISDSLDFEIIHEALFNDQMLSSAKLRKMAQRLARTVALSDLLKPRLYAHEFAARREALFRECEHSSVVPTFDEQEADKLTREQVRVTYPRFVGTCPDCGLNSTLYASYAHYLRGDWR